MHATRFILPASLLAAATLLAGCSAYTPILPATPLVQKGEVEVSANWQLPWALNASAAYSPANHLLLLGQYAVRPRESTEGDSLDISSRQYEVGLGGYHIFGEGRWYVAGTAGYGQVWAHRRGYDRYGIVIYTPTTYLDQESRFRKYFGQAYIAYQTPRTADAAVSVAAGLALRYTKAQLTYLSDANTYPVVVRTKWFTEPVAFVRLGGQWWQVQSYVGLAVPHTANTGEEYDRPIWPNPSLQLGVGLTLNPVLLFRDLQPRR